MRPRKLYIKIFLSFVGVLLITEVMIFGLFVVAAGRTFQERFEHYTQAKTLVARQLVAEKLVEGKGMPLDQNQALMQTLKFLAATHEAKFWISDSQGKVLAASFKGPLPDVRNYHERTLDPNPYGFSIKHRFRRGLRIQIKVPLGYAPRPGLNLMVHFTEKKPAHSGPLFAMGLAVVGLVVALLIIPVTRLITRPVNRLRASAQRIAEGDLSHRADIASRDEIGQLGSAFNHMADVLAGMIRGGKELTANLSHELRSPLARIRVAEEILGEHLEQGKYDGCAKYQNIIREEIGELDRLIGRILELSKLDLRRGEQKTQAVDLDAALSEALDRYQTLLNHNEISVLSHIDQGLTIKANQEELLSALCNALENAVKYTPKGGRLALSLYSRQDMARLTITNTSPPLAPEDLARIFEPFYRAPVSQSAGTGLGLAICKRIVEKCSGTLSARYDEEGFSLIFEFPLLNVPK